MQRVFVYGTLKRGEPNHEVIRDARNGSAEYLGMAETVHRYPLVIASRYNIPFLVKAPDAGHKIIGEIFQVDETMLNFLDQFEGHPQYYERESIPIKWLDPPADSEESVWVYFLTKYKPFMLDLPFLQNYTSNGSHNLPYVPRYKRNSEDRYNAYNEVKYL